jgi:FkbM family methyltransferase
VSGWRDACRRAFIAAGFTVHRWPASRFDGMHDALVLLKRAGYEPEIVIDCGANTGQWNRIALSVFPGAAYHLFEPQASCAAALQGLAHRTGRMTLHHAAVTEPGVAEVRMIDGGSAGGGTGAWVARPGEVAIGESVCRAVTLDECLGGVVTPGQRVLLRLVIEGHEVAVLRGARRVLESVEVVLSEVQFYEIGDNQLPTFIDLLRALDGSGFELYDVACLSARPRDQRLRMGDAVFVRLGSQLLADRGWA